MPLKPWYRVLTPREDLRAGRPLDAAEFAVHLDQVRDGRAPAVYQQPEQFFGRTYLTHNLAGLAVWRSYKYLVVLGKNNELRTVDLGLLHSSAAPSPVAFILQRLQQDGDLEESIGPNFLVRNWPPAFTEWSTRGLRDAFYASPVFPRLLRPDALKETIARGVTQGVLGYVGKRGSGYQPFYFTTRLSAQEVELSEDMYIITAATAEAYLAAQRAPEPVPPPEPLPGDGPRPKDGSNDGPDHPSVAGGAAPKVAPPRQPAPGRSLPIQLEWAGQLPPQKWTTFYMKVLSKLATSGSLGLDIRVSYTVPDGIPEQQVEEIRAALRELGLPDQVDLRRE